MIEIEDCKKLLWDNSTNPPCPNGLSNVGSSFCQRCEHNKRNDHHVVYCGYNLTEDQRRK